MPRDDDWRRFADAAIDLDGATLGICVTITLAGVPCVDLMLVDESQGRVDVALDADKAQRIGMQLIAAALVLRRRQEEG